MTRHTTNLLLMGSLLTISIGATAIADTLTEAVASYQSAMQSSDRQERINGFRRAELLFRKAIEDSGGAANGDLYANLGTACLSGEQIGPAIVAYRKALQLNPQHDQSRKNLTYARELLPSWARKSDSNSPLNIFRSNASARIDLPVHIGIAGPAKLQTLIKFAIACGVGPSLKVLQKRAMDVTKLLLPYEPTEVIAELAAHKAANPDFGIEQVHFFPLGGIKANATWAIENGGEGTAPARPAAAVV